MLDSPMASALFLTEAVERCAYIAGEGGIIVDENIWARKRNWCQT